MARALAEAAVMEEQKASSPTVEAPPVADSGRRLDASAIHELVKKLADETGAAPNVSIMSPPRTSVAGAVQPDPAVVPERIAEQVPSSDPGGSDDAITDSVRALRVAADAMRPVEAPEEMEAVDVEERLALLADALTADRIDVMLEPIIGLKDQATRHYEVSVSLRTLEGLRIDPNESRHLLDGTGILPLIDLAKISRIAEVARLLAERGKSGAVFAGFAGESLGDNDFMARFSEIYNDRMAITEQLVISLAQEDVRAFAPAHWAMIKDLGSAGFRFALEHLTDLDMDFDTLRASGIQYVKLDADIFLQGLMAGEGVMVPAEEVYSFLAGKGLSLIVDHIASETQLMRIVDCGVLYGQGQLFGGPRAVKAKVFATRSAA